MKLLFYLFIKPLSLLPLPILYIFSDGLYFVIHYVVGYRKKVVHTNLKNSFPAKSEAERQEIAKQFYKHFCDYIVECLRLVSISSDEFRKRVKIKNPELLKKYQAEGKDLAIISGHHGNWEYAVVGAAFQLEYLGVAIYKPLSNTFFEKIVKDYRSRFGLQLIKKGNFRKELKDYTQEQIALFFIADQCPSGRQKAHWMTFLNQETPVMMGAEIYSRRYDYVAVAMNTTKVKRGYYELSFALVEEQPKQSELGFITEQSARILEQHIRLQPAYWLWTHRRWKRKRITKEQK
ncbi:MAG: lysophospholipid acyltransferase family protein [Bacteroidota bacterium]